MPKDAEAYVLTGQTGLRSRVICLNGTPLVLGENDELPALTGNPVSGKVALPAHSCAEKTTQTL